MTSGVQLEFLDLSRNFFQNIDYKGLANEEEVMVNNIKNKEVLPKFRTYKDDTNLNLTPKFLPPYLYKNKNLFPPEKPSQTEYDEIGVNVPFLNTYYNYTDYGNYKVQNQSLPEKNSHRVSYNNQLFEVQGL
jgi:hypothetical protein